MFSLSYTARQGVQNNTVTIRIGFSVVYVQFISNTQAGAGGTKQDCHNKDRVQCGLCLVYLTHLGRGRGYKTRLSQSGQGLVWFMFSLSDTPRQGQGVQNNTVTIRIGFSVVYVQFICNTSVGAEGTKQDCHNQDKVQCGLCLVYVQFILQTQAGAGGTKQHFHNQDRVQCGLCLVYLTHLGRGRGYKTRLSQSEQGLVWFMFSLAYTPRQGQGVQNKTVTIRIGFSVVYVQFICNTSRGRGYKTTLSQSGQGLVWFMFSLSYTPRQGQGVQNKTVTIRIGFSVVYVQFSLHTQAGAGGTKQHCRNQDRVQCGLCLVYLQHLGRGRGYKTRLSQSGQGLVWFMFSLSDTPPQGVHNNTVAIRIGFSVVYVQFICNTSVGAEGTKQDCHNQDRVQCGLGLVYLTHLGRGRGYKTRLSQSGQGLVWFMFSLSDTPPQGVHNNTVAIRIGFSVVYAQFI